MFNNDVRLRALEDAGRGAVADRAEEGDPLLQRRHAAQRPGQPGRAALGDQRRRPRERVDLPGRHARPAGRRPRRRRDAGQRPRLGALLRPRRAAAVRAARVVAGHADVARRRHRRTRVHRLERFRRRRSRACSATCPPTTCSATAATNTDKDGRFRRSRCASRTPNYEGRGARPATTPIATSRTPSQTDRETQLQDQMFAAVSPPICRCWSPAAGSGSPPIATTCRSSLTVPGSAVPVGRTDKDPCRSTCSASCSDERNFPVGRFRETLKLPPGTGKTLAGKQMLYQSGVTLPPGRFSVKVVVRENTQRADGIVRGAGDRPGTEDRRR